MVPSNPSFHHNITFQLGSSTITPSTTARNLGAMIDDQLSFSDQIPKTVQSCRFALFNIKKIRPFLWERASQLLVQALVLSRLLQCSLGRSSSLIYQTSTINPERGSRLIFNEPKIIHITPLFINLQWLPIAAQCINVCLQNHLWLCTSLPKFITSDLCAL